MLCTGKKPPLTQKNTPNFEYIVEIVASQRLNLLLKTLTDLSRANNADVSLCEFNKPNAFLSTSMQRIGSTTIAEIQNSDDKWGKL